MEQRNPTVQCNPTKSFSQVTDEELRRHYAREQQPLDLRTINDPRKIRVYPWVNSQDIKRGGPKRMPPFLNRFDWDEWTIGYGSFDICRKKISDLLDCAEGAVHHTWNYLPRLQQAASSSGFADSLTEGALGNNWLHRGMKRWEGASSTGGANLAGGVYACGSVAWALSFATSLRVVLVEYRNGYRSCFFGASIGYGEGLSWVVADGSFEYPVPCRPMENKRDLQPHNIEGFGIVDVVGSPNQDTLIAYQPRTHRLPAQSITPTRRDPQRIDTNWGGELFQGEQQCGRFDKGNRTFPIHPFSMEKIAIYPEGHPGLGNLKERFTNTKSLAPFRLERSQK